MVLLLFVLVLRRICWELIGVEVIFGWVKWWKFNVLIGVVFLFLLYSFFKFFIKFFFSLKLLNVWGCVCFLFVSVVGGVGYVGKLLMYFFVMLLFLLKDLGVRLGGIVVGLSLNWWEGLGMVLEDEKGSKWWEDVGICWFLGVMFVEELLDELEIIWWVWGGLFWNEVVLEDFKLKWFVLGCLEWFWLLFFFF